LLHHGAMSSSVIERSADDLVRRSRSSVVSMAKRADAGAHGCGVRCACRSIGGTVLVHTSDYEVIQVHAFSGYEGKILDDYAWWYWRKATAGTISAGNKRRNQQVSGVRGESMSSVAEVLTKFYSCD
jgi:hypothetical protein